MSDPKAFADLVCNTEVISWFLEEHQIDNTEELEMFSEMVHLLLAEPNVPLVTIN